MRGYFTELGANVGRGVYTAARQTTEAFESTREKIARVIGASAGEIAYTKSTTEAINLVASGLNLKPGDQVIVSRFEHHSNFLPWQRLTRNGIRVDVVGFSPDCLLDPAEFEEAICRETKLIAIHHISNAVGSLQPVKEISRLAGEAGALCLVDAAQSVGHIPVDVREIGCDYLAAPGHKGLMGPPGTGFLYIRDGAPVPEPLLTGGGIVTERCAGFEFVGSPRIFDAGTPNIPGIIGLGAGCEYVLEIGLERIAGHESRLAKELLSLRNVDGVDVYGPADPLRRGALVSFNVRGMEPHAAASVLDMRGFAVRSGHQCALPTMRHLGIEGTVRASVGYYNTLDDVRRFVEAVEEMASGRS